MKRIIIYVVFTPFAILGAIFGPFALAFYYGLKESEDFINNWYNNYKRGENE